MAKASSKILHITLNLGMNEDSWRWNDPRGEVNFDFDMPVELFSATLFAKMIEKKLDVLEVAYQDAVLQLKLKQEREEAEAEASRIRAEAEQNVTLTPA